MRLRKLIVAITLPALVLAACGGSGTGTPTTRAASAGVPTTADSGLTGDNQGPGTTGAPGDSQNPRATVTIGAETFTFSHQGVAASSNCRPNDNGAFRALLLLVGDDGELTVRSDLDLVLFHDQTGTDGSESSSISVRLGHLDDGGSSVPGWYANAGRADRTGLPAGTAQVDSYVIDGNSVSGTATFVDSVSDTAFFRGRIDSVESVQGSFVVTCGS